MAPGHTNSNNGDGGAIGLILCFIIYAYNIPIVGNRHLMRVSSSTATVWLRKFSREMMDDNDSWNKFIDES